MHICAVVDFAVQLPVRVWARIVQHLRPDSKSWTELPLSSLTPISDQLKALLGQQAAFHQLKLVCSSFNQMFAEHPKLYDSLVVMPVADRTDCTLWQSSLFAAAQQMRRHSMAFTALGGSPNLALILEALACPDSILARD